MPLKCKGSYFTPVTHNSTGLLCAHLPTPRPLRLTLLVLRFAGIQILKATQKGKKSETRIQENFDLNVIIRIF